MKTQTSRGWMTLTLFVLTTAPLGAATMTWNNNGTDYNSASNWTGGLPGPADTASFPAAVTNQPVISATITNQRISFSGSGWTVSSVDATQKLVLTGTGSGGGAAAMDGNQLASNTLSAPIVLGAAAGSTQHVYQGNNGATFTIAGSISEATGPVALQLDGNYGYPICLSGSNTFSGGLVYINGPIFQLGSHYAVPVNGSFVCGQLPSAYPDIAGQIYATDNFSKRISCPFTMYANPATSNRLVFGSGTAGRQGGIVFKGSGTLMSPVALRVASVSGDDVCSVAFEGTIAESGGSSGLTLVGAHNNNAWRGYTFLLGTNTYSGPSVLFAPHVSLTTIGGLGGACVIDSIADAGTACSLGAPTGGDATIAMSVGTMFSGTIYYPDGTLRYIGTGHSSSRPFQFGAVPTSADTSTAYLRLDASGAGALNLSGNMTIADNSGTTTRAVWLSGTSTNDNTFAGVIPATTTRTSTLTKDGRGTWVLSGSNTFNGTLAINSGRLVLDYANNATVVPTSTALALGGGTLELRGKSAGSSAQTIGAVTTSGQSGLNAILINQNGGAGTALTAGSLTINGGSALLFDLSGSSGSSATVGTSLTSVNGAFLIRDSANGLHFATNTGVNTAIVAYDATADLPANPVNTGNYRLTGSQTVSNAAVRSLRIVPLAGQSLTVNGDFQIAGQGILFVGTNDFTIGGSGTLYAGQYATLVISHFGNGKLTLNANLGAASDSTHQLLFAGTGLIDWVKRYQNNQAANYPTISGVTVRNSSTGGLLLNTNATGAGSCSLVLTGGGIVELTDADFTRNVGTGAGAVQWKGDGGFSAYGAARAVRLNNGTASIHWPNLWSLSSFVPANNALILGSPYSDNTIDFQNGLFFGCQQRVVCVNDGVAATNVDARLSGDLTGRYGGGLIKEGPGTLEITGTNNTYEGDTWVREGALRVSGSIANSAVKVFRGAVLSGTGTVNRLTLDSGGVLKPYASGGVLGGIQVTGAADLSNGTLDLSGAGVLAAGDQPLVQCGARNGEFAVVTGLPGGRSIQYTPIAVVLKYTPGTVLMLN